MPTRKLFLALFLLLLAPLTIKAEPSQESSSKNHPRVIMETSMGKIKIELFDEKAPVTVKNFRNYLKQDFYNGLIFHRVIPNFMIQGGGFEPGMEKRNPTQMSIKNEATNGLKNKRGTIAMARTRDINSATSQFFINVVDNPNLDNRGTAPHLYGYAVFGKVVEGMDVADKIAATETTSVRTGSGTFRDVPKKDVLIIKVYEEK